VANLLRIEVVVGENGRLSMVRCKIYDVAEHGDKLLVPKFVEHCDKHHANQNAK
jgi:hypothetical protein